MVYKVSKGGVRSGNTLRGLRSYRTRRNTRQACIVGRSNLKPKEIPEFLDSHFEDELISSSLGSTDVALSLNKKKRWLLPATVGHMIKTGSFNDEKTMVSLLERHKLKRRANCVSFVCNQVRHVAPGQKKYFSFKLDNIDNELSIRQKRRQKAEPVKQENLLELKITKNKYHRRVKTYDVFTVLGTEKLPEKKTTSFESSKPELRLEVFYPCPQSCSLSYNPKYTNVHMEFGEEGEVELKSEKKVSKKAGKRRTRFNFKDYETYDPEIVSLDTEEAWDDNYEYAASSNDGFQGKVPFKTRAKHSLDKDYDTQFDEEADEEIQENENILASLVAQAEKARSLCENKKVCRRQKQTPKSFDDQRFALSHQNRSHIVYINEEDLGLEFTDTEKTMELSTPKTEQKINTINYVTLTPARVILKSGETTPGNLRAKFGRFYAEAESEPRRFGIDVTEDVQSLVCPYRDAELSAVFTSFLVFVHDGVYDEGLDTFKVIFNSNCCPETIDFKDNIPFRETFLEEIMNRVVSTVLDMREDNLLDVSYDHAGGNATIPILKLADNAFKVVVSTIHPSDEFRKVSQTEVMQENVDCCTSLDSIVRDLDCDIFCDICYESINPTQAWDVSGTRLLKCSHIFCDDCWRSHLRAKLKDGSLKMRCPGYDCDETVGPVTMLSLLHVSEVSKFFQRKCEEEADSSTNSRWCPNRDCGRVIKLDTERSTDAMTLDVTCTCGQEFCFSCLSHPHWPATCEQAVKYADELQALANLTKSKSDPEASNDPKPKKIYQTKKYRQKAKAVPTPVPDSLTKNRYGGLEIEGRLCPKCSKFIEKNGGCPYIKCKCGHYFCWECLNPCLNHVTCLPAHRNVFNSIIKVRINHQLTPADPKLSLEDLNNIKSDGLGQMKALYKKAVEEKQEMNHHESSLRNKTQINEMVKQIAHVAQRDLNLKSEILSLCGLEIDDKDNGDLIRFPLVPHVTKFLRSCCELKRALHHVAEFTFVLLQDTADSVDKRRALRLANDLSGYCSFIRSILESGQRQDMGAAVKRLADIQTWAKRALTILLATVNKLRR